MGNQVPHQTNEENVPRTIEQRWLPTTGGMKLCSNQLDNMI